VTNALPSLPVLLPSRQPARLTCDADAAVGVKCEKSMYYRARRPRPRQQYFALATRSSSELLVESSPADPPCRVRSMEYIGRSFFLPLVLRYEWYRPC